MTAVLLVRRGWAVRQTARYIGVSPGTVNKWMARAPSHGRSGIPTQSSRPHNSPGKIAPEIEAMIVAERQRTNRCGQVVHHVLRSRGVEVSLATVTAFEDAVTSFPFPMLGVQTDNGSENRGVFHQYLGDHGIAHYFVPKNSPNWQGAVERAHGVIDQEFYLNELRPWQTLAEYLTWYNTERIHLGKYLNGLTPREKFLEYQSKVSVLTVN